MKWKLESRFIEARAHDCRLWKEIYCVSIKLFNIDSYKRM